MRLTHICEYNARDPNVYSGTPYSIFQNLRREVEEVQLLPLLHIQKLLPPFQELLFQSKKIWLNYVNKEYLCSEYFFERALHIGKLFNQLLRSVKTDAILATITPLSAAFLETDTPIVYWTDAVFAALANFYPAMRSFHADSQYDGHLIMNSCLMNSRVVIFSSQWAARTAVEYYGISKDKIRVVPFGANLTIDHSYDDIKEVISKRSKTKIKLLFIGKNWYRKGGDIVVETAKTLHSLGHSVELTIVGCAPDEKFPDYIKCEQFLSKSKQEDINKLKQLYLESHFFFMPSRAEAYGIVFCEANAFGVPCIATYVGGIPEIIKDGINGKMFSLEATVEHYCEYIISLMSDRESYQSLALSTFNEYETRLNWQRSLKEVRKIITEIL